MLLRRLRIRAQPERFHERVPLWFAGGAMKERNELTWRKSSWSSGGSCVEIAEDGTEIVIRHSQHPDGPILRIDRSVFSDFIACIKKS
jgi:hypothetical protein